MFNNHPWYIYIYDLFIGWFPETNPRFSHWVDDSIPVFDVSFPTMKYEKNNLLYRARYDKPWIPIVNDGDPCSLLLCHPPFYIWMVLMPFPIQ